MTKKELESLNKNYKYTKFNLNKKGEIFVDYGINGLVTFNDTVKEYKDLFLKIREELFKKFQTEFEKEKQSVYNTSILFDQVDEIVIKSLDRESKKFFEKEILSNAKQSKKQIYDMIKQSSYFNENVRKTLTNLDKQLIRYTLQDTYQDVALRTRQTAQQVKNYIRNASSEAFRTASIKGEGYFKIFKNLVDKFDENNFNFIDNAGRRWNAVRYSEMLARTKIANTQRDLNFNNLSKLGADLVVVRNTGRETCTSCTSYNNMVLSISGTTKFIESVNNARNKKGSHLFGPNCDCYTTMFDLKGLALDLEIEEKEIINAIRVFKTEDKIIKRLMELGKNE